MINWLFFLLFTCQICLIWKVWGLFIYIRQLQMILPVEVLHCTDVKFIILAGSNWLPQLHLFGMGCPAPTRLLRPNLSAIQWLNCCGYYMCCFKSNSAAPAPLKSLWGKWELKEGWFSWIRPQPHSKLRNTIFSKSHVHLYYCAQTSIQGRAALWSKAKYIPLNYLSQFCCFISIFNAPSMLLRLEA